MDPPKQILWAPSKTKIKLTARKKKKKKNEEKKWTPPPQKNFLTLSKKKFTPPKEKNKKITPPHTPKCLFWTLSKVIFWNAKKMNKKKLDHTIQFFSLHGNDNTICIGREIQCLQYAGFLFGSLDTNEYLLLLILAKALVKQLLYMR